PFLVGSILAGLSAMVPLMPTLGLCITLVALAIFGLNFSSCLLIALVSDVFPETTMARVTGLTGMGEGVMNMVLTLVTGVVVDRFSFAPVFVGAGVMPLVSVAAMFLFVRQVRRVTLT